jgi:hypothetical protein
MGRGDRARVRWSHERKRKEKARRVRRAKERGEQRKAAK